MTGNPKIVISEIGPIRHIDLLVATSGFLVIWTSSWSGPAKLFSGTCFDTWKDFWRKAVAWKKGSDGRPWSSLVFAQGLTVCMTHSARDGGGRCRLTSDIVDRRKILTVFIPDEAYSQVAPEEKNLQMKERQLLWGCGIESGLPSRYPWQWMASLRTKAQSRSFLGLRNGFRSISIQVG